MRTPIDIKPAFFVGLALSILLIPLEWVVAWIVAAAVHELFHLLILWICGCRVHGVHITMQGARIETGPLTKWETILCAAAGPVGSLSLLLLIKWFPVLSLCGCIQGLYNLLPVYPMDGWRVLDCLTGMMLPPKWAENLMRWIQRLVHICLMAAGAYAMLQLSLGPLPLLFALTVLMKGRKFPCKWCAKKVQ